MNIYKDFIKTSKAHEVILAILFIAYTLFEFSLPSEVLILANNMIFQAILGIMVVSLFLYVNPIVGILAIIAFMVFIHRAKKQLNNLVSSEPTRQSIMTAFNANNNSITLEEEVVNKMSQVNKPLIDTSGFQPVLNDVHNALMIG